MKFKLVCDWHKTWFMIPENKYDEWISYNDENNNNFQARPDWMLCIGDYHDVMNIIFENPSME